MMMKTTLALLASISASMASPMPHLVERQATVTVTATNRATSYPQPAYEIPGFAVHSSCNGTERAQIDRALGDTIKLAQEAAKYVYTYGNESELYSKYFGKAPTGEVIGWYEKVVYGQREGILFRCDDIDNNCHLDGWGGHWRGENATMETVICPLSYEVRQPLESLCGHGYTVAAGPLNTYFASDLLHRLYHVPSMGEEAVEHYADTYAECLALAEEEPTQAVRNSHTLQYFALDVYAHEVILPGEGCTGKAPAESSSSSVVASITSTSSAAASEATATSETSSAEGDCQTMSSGEVLCVAAATSSAEAAAVTTEAATPTTAEDTTDTATAGKNCHTHDGGELHCV